VRTHDFGGFSTRTCSIDLRFSSPAQFEHFVKAWSQAGRPDIEADTPEGRMELISTGTTLEHELRHYHDFLLSYGALHNYWQRAQAMMNATPIISQMLNDSNLDMLVFPAMDWARADLAAREAYLADTLGDGSVLTRTWAPPVIDGPRPPSKIEDGLHELTDDNYRHALYVLRDQMARIEGMRGGIDDPQFPFPFTPRFVAEHSSLLVQCASVQQTYGFADLDFFMTRLAEDGSLYARFFSSMALIFSGRSLPMAKGSVTVVDAREIDWRALGVGVTWCFCGSTDEPTLLKPVDRMARLIEAVLADRAGVFPPRLGFADLFRHLDSYFHVEAAHLAARRNSDALRELLRSGRAKLAAASEITRSFESVTDVFEALLDERDRVVGRIMDDPEGYMDAGRYVRALPQWPQCPVSFDFAPAGMVVYKDVLARMGADPVFEDTIGEDGSLIEDAVVQVSYPSFLPGGTSFPWRKAKALADRRDLFDMFFDPQQIGVEREQQIRRLIAQTNGKTLIRYIG
jgi:hypothetical protein